MANEDDVLMMVYEVMKQPDSERKLRVKPLTPARLFLLKAARLIRETEGDHESYSPDMGA